MSFRTVEKVLTCPYNPAHQILPHRMAQHLVKCKKSHPDADMKVCVFNATHVVPTHLYQAHILECPDKSIVERDIYRRREVENRLQARQQLSRPVVPTHAVCTEEDWDAETVTSSYNPMEHLIHREIARPPPPGLGKAAKKNWREMELERIRRLKTGEPIDDLISQENEMFGSQLINTSSDSLSQYQSLSKTASSNISLAMQSDRPLRLPKLDKDPSALFAQNRIYSRSSGALSSFESTPTCRQGIETPSVESLNVQASDELRKEEKKMFNKLKEVKKLEGKAAAGKPLNAQEQIKLAKRSEFEERLTEVRKTLESLGV